MISNRFTIRGGDYEQAGAASSALKVHLKRVGAAPEAVRRAMIAAYEAEMNVVIHADNGDMTFSMDTEKLKVEVTDEGPGIPDIALAMTEGYSTAPSVARELGFGAGMGLPNIKKNSDRFSINSVVGQGTRVEFTILLSPQRMDAAAHNSVAADAQKCRQCLRCISACPTEALRLVRGKLTILDHLCIDCAACIGACSTGALGVKGLTPALPEHRKGMALVLPAAFLSQFGAGVGGEQIVRVLGDIGFEEVIVADAWEVALREAVIKCSEEGTVPRPVISPACPAVVNLVESRFPSLIAHLAPFCSPLEAIRHGLAGRSAIFVIACPGQRSVLERDSGVMAIAPATLRHVILPQVVALRREAPKPVRETKEGPESPGLLRVSGIRHVINVLEDMENGLLQDMRVIETAACEQGCFGSPLLSEDPFVGRHRWETSRAMADVTAAVVKRSAPYAARPGVRLDPDMAQAIAKLSRIEKLTKSLPGRDCAMCGAPTCAAFAEDVVLGRAEKSACCHLTKTAAEKEDSQ
ncbi:MAG: [Fe-Fe] hydrogenase large subunit C-terminal domain-containing protein [Planctomycetota bacterium]